MARKKNPDSITISEGGKANSVRIRLPNGEVEDVCLCRYNIDLARACIAQVPVELLSEVVENDGFYNEGYLGKYKAMGLTNKKCIYCYGRSINGNSRSRIVTDKTFESFEKYRPKIVRLSKLTESGHPFYYENLIMLLNVCEEYQSEVIFPTKMMPFGLEGAIETTNFSRDNINTVEEISKKVDMMTGEKMAGLLKRVGGVLSYSIGYDRFEIEPGVNSQGFTNDWRLVQAERYFNKGVNTTLTVVCDPTQSIDENVGRGSGIEKAIDLWRSAGIPLRLIPLRTYGRKVAGLMNSQSWDEMNSVCPGNRLLFSDNGSVEQRIYKKDGKHFNPYKMHDDFSYLIRNGVKVCGNIGEKNF